MSNMSYCRFRNTLSDLRDCEDAMSEDQDGEELSVEEKQARKSLIKLCQKIVLDYSDPKDIESLKQDLGVIS